MAKLRERLWNWGHLEGSHNAGTGLECRMTPEQFAEEYGIPNAFIVSYGGNIQPPFDAYAKRFSRLRELKWSVLGDAGTPIPEHRLGNTEDILAVAETANITGGVVDDFFSPDRLERFPPAVLSEIRARFNERGMDFWSVLYENQLGMDLSAYFECFDGITFWIWGTPPLAEMDRHIELFEKRVGARRKMLGVYLWDYPGIRPMDPVLFRKQVEKYFGMLREGRAEGVIFCSGTIGDAPLETNRILKELIAEYGDLEVAE